MEEQEQPAVCGSGEVGAVDRLAAWRRSSGGCWWSGEEEAGDVAAKKQWGSAPPLLLGGGMELQVRGRRAAREWEKQAGPPRICSYHRPRGSAAAVTVRALRAARSTSRSSPNQNNTKKEGGWGWRRRRRGQKSGR